MTTPVGMALLSLERRVPPGRVFLLNPGERLDVGDRRLTAFRPPLHDSPATTGLLDELTGACFGSDCFGAPITAGDLVQSDDVGAVPEADLVAGERLWAAVERPWSEYVDRDVFLSELARLRDFDLSVVLGAHLSPAHHRVEALLDTLADTRDAPGRLGPDE